MCSLDSHYNVGSFALKFIFNPNAEFYKVADIEESAKYPLGKMRPLSNYAPVIDEECDVVKPYVTSINECGWVRCKVL